MSYEVLGAPFKMGGGFYTNDLERGGVSSSPFASDAFTEASVRSGFIRKVYAILTIQLIITLAIVAAFVYIEPVKTFVLKNEWTYLLALILTLVLMVTLVCCEGVRRRSPLNLILLGLFTCCEGFLIATVTLAFETEAVVMAVVICVVIVAGLTLFAFQTKYDFTTCSGLLCGLVLTLFVASIFMIFIPYNKWVSIVFASFGALVFCLFIVVDTQLMMGGKHKVSVDPEEYIFAALNLYLDVINLFLYLLLIIQGVRSD